MQYYTRPDDDDDDDDDDGFENLGWRNGKKWERAFLRQCLCQIISRANDLSITFWG